MKNQGWVFAAVAAVCLTQQDIRNAECGVGCRREGYVAGRFDPSDKTCICEDHYAFTTLTGKKLVLPNRVSFPVKTPSRPFMFPEDD